ncbi:uncharacterized protein METZ01_LOCUS502992, partial [marine metagenome]
MKKTARQFQIILSLTESSRTPSTG